MSHDLREHGPEIDFGTTVYTENGTELGTIRGFDEEGFYVVSEENVDTLEVEGAAEGEHGRAVMWRCWECGEMGRIDDDFPDNCPACEAPREEIYYWTED